MLWKTPGLPVPIPRLRPKLSLSPGGSRLKAQGSGLKFGKPRLLKAELGPHITSPEWQRALFLNRNIPKGSVFSIS